MQSPEWGTKKDIGLRLALVLISTNHAVVKRRSVYWPEYFVKKYKLLDLSTRARESLVPWITERDFVAVLYPEM